MAYQYAPDLYDDPRRKLEGSSAPIAAPSGAGGGPAASAPAPSSGFVNFSQYFNANKDTAAQQGNAYAADLEKRGVGALFGEDPGAAGNVAGEIGSAQRIDTMGMNPFDASMTYRGAGDRLAGMKGLGGALGAVEAMPEGMDAVRPALTGEQAYPAEYAVHNSGGPAGDLVVEAAGKARQQDAQRYATEMQPYNDYFARRDANRAPFQGLYDYYYGGK